MHTVDVNRKYNTEKILKSVTHRSFCMKPKYHRVAVIEYDIIQEEIVMQALACECCGRNYELSDVQLDGVTTGGTLEIQLSHVERALENGVYDKEFIPYAEELLSELRRVLMLLERQDNESTTIEINAD